MVIEMNTMFVRHPMFRKNICSHMFATTFFRIFDSPMMIVVTHMDNHIRP